MTRTIKTFKIALGVWLAASALFAPSVLAQDKVYQNSGTILTGEITNLANDEVTITVRGKSQTVPTNVIGRVTFDGEPVAFGRVKEFVSQGQWDQAETDFRTIDTKTIKGENSQQDYLFYRGLITGQLALSGRGDPSAAKTALQKFYNSSKSPHHYYEFCEMMGNLAAAAGNFDEAKKAFAEIGKAPFPEYQLKSGYLIGETALRQNKPDEALAEFEKVKAASATDPVSQRYQKLATVAAIRCNIVKGDAKTAVDQLLKLAEESDSADVALFANICNTLGEAHLALSEPNNAKLSYLQTDLLFSTDPEKHAEALYHLSRLWDQTGEPQRATDARTRLKEQYGGSIWAKK
jgi:tetratricopeptide (TPR) repeat protein